MPARDEQTRAQAVVFESTMSTFVVGTSHSSSNLPISATGPVYTRHASLGVALTGKVAATYPRRQRCYRDHFRRGAGSGNLHAAGVVALAPQYRRHLSPRAEQSAGSGRQVGQDRGAGALRQRTKSSEAVAMDWLRHYTPIRMNLGNAERQFSSLPWDDTPGADEVRDLVEQVEPDGSD